MNRAITACTLTLLALTGACKAPSSQHVARPDEHAAVASNACRVYLTRAEDFRSSVRSISIIDSGVTIGRISGNEYLCWDRPATQGVGQAFYEGFDPDYGNVENVFDLPRDAGATAFLCVKIGELKKPEIVRLSPEEGKALIAKRRAVPTK